MTIDEALVPSAIVEFHAAKNNGRDDSEAWEAAIGRVRYDVLRMAALICEQEGGRFGSETAEEAACHACAKAIEGFYHEQI